MIADPVLINDWHPVAQSRDVEPGKVLGVRLLGEAIVLWRVGEKVLAWQDLCMHRGTRLSLGRVEDETLVCAYHGWTYASSGQCVRFPAHPEQIPPAKARVKTYHVREAYDLVWVSLGQPSQDIPPFPEWDDASFRKMLCGPYRFNASGPRIVENFLDIAHFPFVHGGILGDPARPMIEDYTVETRPDGVTARNVRIWQPDPYGTGQGDTVAYTYHVFRPLTAYFAKESDGPRVTILLIVTPQAEVESIAWMWMAMNYAHDTPAEALVGWQDQIVAQDIPIVESQRPELLPLDLQAELHLRSDRAAVAYRKWLAEVGLTFGTA
jgi:phenylpropionate dioxygenase-like ring-hydroxylating dioxygenase large terminal subunit